MRLIISPAKKMTVDTDSLPVQSLPQFLSRAEQLCERLQGMCYEELKALWRCNDQIAAQNFQRLQGMNLRKNLTPAILSYEGIQYQYMAPGVFTADELAYVGEHLRILSGFYGVLRPFDGVTPYRLEMQAKLSFGEAKDLYSFWGDAIAKNIFAEDGCIVNLASREYSLCISRYLRPPIRFVTCVFGDRKGSKIVEKGTMCKMARGEMVRFLAEEQIKTPEQMRRFDRLHYRFLPEESSENLYVFVREPPSKLKCIK